MDVLLSILFSDSFVNSQEWTLSRSVPDIRYVCQDWEAGGWGGSIETCWCWGCLSSLEPLSQFVDTHNQVGNRRQSLKREICSCTSLSHRKLYAGFIFYKYAGFIFYKTDLMKEHMTNIKICMTSIFWILILQEESPEGGRFKKEIVVDGQSYLLLIRDEGGPPELQVGSINSFW